MHGANPFPFELSGNIPFRGIHFSTERNFLEVVGLAWCYALIVMYADIALD